MRQQPPPLPAPRLRTPSGHDVPIPEAVFTALHGVQQEVRASAQQAATWQANHDVEHKELIKALAEVKATNLDRWTNLLKVVLPSIVAIVGGVVGANKLTAASPPAPTVVYESALSASLARCMGLPEGEQRFCREDAYEADRARRQGRP